MIDWLRDAVFYEIYPQSFYDTNGDGIGDFKGILRKLDYIKSLGCNAIWLNPCFDSPFSDAGYDVRDYEKTAARYGTNEDLVQLFTEAHQKGIRIILDLVPGHTSEEHPWFKESGKAEKNKYSGRYIWTEHWMQPIPGHPYVAGNCDRDGTYYLNFFQCQPALNYGFLHPTESWQKPMDDPDCLATRDAIREVIRFWLSKGCDGFRVDMADSLVKEDDENKSGTCEVWRDILAPIRKEFPEAVFVSEWNRPEQSINSAGFDVDFYLDWPGNGYHALLRDTESGEDKSFFKKGPESDITRFLEEYLPRYTATKENGYIALITCNHDTPRPRRTLTPDELKIAYAMIFTLPGVPFLYYGDEIGMRYLDVPTKEGGYTRTGSRTPMQWDHTENYGFSKAKPEALYLPVDPDKKAPTVESEEKDADSLLNVVRRVLKFRESRKDFRSDVSLEILQGEKGKPFVYRRERMICMVNPSSKEETVELPELHGAAEQLIIGEIRMQEDKEKKKTKVLMHGGSFAILKVQ